MQTNPDPTIDSAILSCARIMDGAKTGQDDIVVSLFVDSETDRQMAYGEPYTGLLHEISFDNADYLDKVEVTTTLQGLHMVANG